jgi:hypothetical protein
VDTAAALWTIGRDASAAFACLAKAQQSDNEKARLMADQLKAVVTRQAKEPN